MSKDGSGRRRSRRHSQPGERTVRTALTLLQESVELGVLLIVQSFAEESEDFLCARVIVSAQSRSMTAIGGSTIRRFRSSSTTA
jgi:hypothetical protein